MTACSWPPTRPTTDSSSTRPPRSTTCSPGATPSCWTVISHDDAPDQQLVGRDLGRPGRRPPAPGTHGPLTRRSPRHTPEPAGRYQRSPSTSPSSPQRSPTAPAGSMAPTGTASSTSGVTDTLTNRAHPRSNTWSTTSGAGHLAAAPAHRDHLPPWRRTRPTPAGSRPDPVPDLPAGKGRNCPLATRLPDVDGAPAAPRRGP